MRLAGFVARRLLIALATLWLISLLIFVIVEILPGDVARLVLGQFATSHDIALVRQQLGLERPPVIRYLDWAGGFMTGHWGNSWRLQTPIKPLIAERLVNSLILGGLAFLVIVPLSALGGIVAALRRGSLLDRLMLLGGMFGIAVPEFVSSMFLILIFSLWLHVLPSSAMIPQGTTIPARIESLLLPVAALGLVLFGYISQTVRASMIDELRSKYVRTAVLKGLRYNEVLVKHVLRNALLPTVTVAANQVSWLVSGLVVVENVFNYPGIGQLLLKAALGKDVPLLEVTVMIQAAILILANLAADVMYGLLNPRISAETSSP
jgi:peptide/nickel transport system permease protein